MSRRSSSSTSLNIGAAKRGNTVSLWTKPQFLVQRLSHYLRTEIIRYRKHLRLKMHSCGASTLYRKLVWRLIQSTTSRSLNWNVCRWRPLLFRNDITQTASCLCNVKTNTNKSVKMFLRNLVSINFNWIYRLSNKLVQIEKQLWVIPYCFLYYA